MKKINLKYLITYLILGFIIPILVGLISVNFGAFLLFLYLISLPVLAIYFIISFIRKTKTSKENQNKNKKQTISKNNKPIKQSEFINTHTSKPKPKIVRSKHVYNHIYKRNLQDRKNKYNYVKEPLQEYIVIDTETTGLYAQYDDIIEISAIKIKNGKVIDQYTSLVNPNKKIPNKSIKIHGITDEMVKDSPRINEVLPKILDFIGNQPLIGHNLSFDLRFINSYLEKNINHKLADTMLISRRTLTDLPNHKLQTLIHYYDLGGIQEHRSLSDCIYTYKVYEKLKENPKTIY